MRKLILTIFIILAIASQAYATCENGSWKVGDTCTFYVQNNGSSGAVDCGSAITYRVYEDETATPVVSGTMALLDSSNTDGFYSEALLLDSWAEKGKSYMIRAICPETGLSITLALQIEAEVDSNTVSGTVPTVTNITNDVGITQAGADKVWGTAARVLTAGTNIALAKGTGVTGFNDLSAADVNAEVDTALNTAIPASPTADSVNERIKAIDDKLPTNYIMGSAVVTDKDDEIDGIKTKTDFLPSATAGAAGGLLISGSNSGTTTLGALTVTGTTTMSDGLVVARSTVNQPAISATGNGTGAGSVIQGGVSGNGLTIVGSSGTNDIVADIQGNLSGSAGSVTGLTASNLDATISSRASQTSVDAYLVASTGTAQTATSSSITLAAGESSAFDVYSGKLLLITGGSSGVGQLRYIWDYDGSTKIAQISPNWTYTPSGTVTYLIYNNQGEVKGSDWRSMDSVDSHTSGANIANVGSVTNVVNANMAQISGDTVAADALEAAYDGTGYCEGCIAVTVSSGAATPASPLVITETTIITVDNQFKKQTLRCGKQERFIAATDNNTADTITVEPGNPFTGALSGTCYIR